MTAGRAGASGGSGRAHSFDRIRPARSETDDRPTVVSARADDHQGKRALFSGADQPPSIGSVAVDCPKCSRRSVISVMRLARLALPGVYVPVPGSAHRAWIKCPACGVRSWVSVSLKP